MCLVQFGLQQTVRNDKRPHGGPYVTIARCYSLVGRNFERIRLGLRIGCRAS